MSNLMKITRKPNSWTLNEVHVLLMLKTKHWASKAHIQIWNILVRINRQNISRLNNDTYFWHMSNNKKNAPETGLRIQTWSSCSFYAQEKAYVSKSRHSNLKLIIKIFLNDKHIFLTHFKLWWKCTEKRIPDSNMKFRFFSKFKIKHIASKCNIQIWNW